MLVNKLPQDVEEESVALWIFILVHMVLTTFVWGPLAQAASKGSVVSTFIALYIFDPTPYLPYLAVGPFIHLFCIPFFILRKKKYLEKERSIEKTASAFEDDGQPVVFSIKFNLCQKIFSFFVGNWIKLGAFVIKLLSG